ncbi:YkgJ family cysteine cluster protein [Streptomyces sp. NPDC005708]|uniref:YkgJ family cysteine cluster protein n=1 Tax=Streptomyces sp. NPDC005708 TaxID=3154564 RepID=UPI0033C7CC56
MTTVDRDQLAEKYLIGDQLARFERQMERGQFFTHAAFANVHQRLRDVEVLLHGLTDILLGLGLVTEPELVRGLESVAPQLVDASSVGVVVASEPDQPAADPEPVDCAARMHVCHAVCCRLDFALSVPEIEAGSARWDLGRPYHIRHEADGNCTHNDRETGRCGIYQDRPSVCRRYSCRGDERIWRDFDQMELNTEWIEANFPSRDSRPRAVFVPIPTIPPRAEPGVAR